MSADPINIDRAPCHSLPGYAAWTLGRCSGAPFDMLWTSFAASAAPAFHRVFPLGEPSLAVRRRRGRDGAIASLDLTICGTYDRAFFYRPAPSEELIAVRLKPETSARLFGVSAVEYLNLGPVPAPRTLAAKFGVTMRIAESGGAREIAMALATETCAQFGAARAERIEETAAAHIRAANGRIHVKTLAGALGVTERHLRRRFLAAVGCTPKTYARRLRLAAAAAAADRMPRPDWAQIALDAGFYDQAHLIGEYKDLTGLTPAQSHAERRESAFSNTDVRF